MNRALAYLAWTLLKRRCLLFCRELKRPLQLISVLLAMMLVGTLFWYRNEKGIGEIVKGTPLAFFLSLLLLVSLVRAFMQRGMLFDQPDIEFLFAGPFKQSHLIFYRLLPVYFGSIVTVPVVATLFWRHFQHPIATGLCIALFQLVCGHLSMAVSIVSGALPEKLFHRLRWVSWALVFLYCATWINKALEDPLDPNAPGRFERAGLVEARQMLFYPAVDLMHIGSSGTFHRLSSEIVSRSIQASSAAVSLGFGFLLLIPAIWLSLRFLLGVRTSIFESAIQANDRHAAIRSQQHRFQPAPKSKKTTQLSWTLPRHSLFRGAAGALIWKNFLCASRSKARLMLGFAYTAVITASALTVVLALRHIAEREDLFELYLVVPSLVGFLPFLLQTTTPFDLRLDGHQFAVLRSLPAKPWHLAQAVIFVPSVLCLAHQALSLIVLCIFARFSWAVLGGMIFGFPAITLTVHLTWNIYYVLFATAESGGPRQKRTDTVAIFLVLSVLFGLFFPSGWVLHRFVNQQATELGILASVSVQYIIIGTLFCIFARLIARSDSATPAPA